MQGDLTNFYQEIKAFSDQLNVLDVATVDVYNLRQVANATGTTLDNVGDQVGIIRPSAMNDTNYRALIYAKIQMNRSGGEPETLIAAIKALTSATSVNYTDYYPGCASIGFAGTSVIDNLWTFTKRLTAGGVALRLVQVDAITPFKLDSATNGLDNGKLGNAINV